MDKNKFDKAQEVDKKINHLEMRLTELRKFKVDGNSMIEISDGDRNRINVYGDQAFIKKVLDEHVANIQNEIIELQNEFDAL